jgi:hypothetical protein
MKKEIVVTAEQTTGSAFRFGGYEDSKAFNFNEGLHFAGCIPPVSTISASVRLVVNVALGVFNLVKTIGYGFVGLGEHLITRKSTFLNHAADSSKALAVNVVACVLSIFEAIPIIGNTPHWIFACCKKCCGHLDNSNNSTPFPIFH